MNRTWWFPDNTVLCNFAAVDRLPLLEKVLDSRGRWTQAVAYEAERSARVLPHLREVAAGGWLGDPIGIDDAARSRGGGPGARSSRGCCTGSAGGGRQERDAGTEGGQKFGVGEE